MQDQKLTKPKTNRTISPYEATQLAKYGHRSPELLATGNQPVEYLTGFVTFCGHEFHVNPAVLIPRVETEELVELVVNSCRRQAATGHQTLNLVDVGTGSGALGLSVALALEELHLSYQLLLTDVSEAALAVARHNQQQLAPNAPIAFHQGNLLTSIPQQKFDVVMANLPYIPSARISTLDSSVFDYEPHLALDGGSDGLQLIAKLLSQLPVFSQPQTEVWLELDETHMEKQLTQLVQSQQVQLIQDSFGKVRFAHVTSKT